MSFELVSFLRIHERILCSPFVHIYHQRYVNRSVVMWVIQFFFFISELPYMWQQKKGVLKTFWATLLAKELISTSKIMMGWIHVTILLTIKYSTADQNLSCLIRRQCREHYSLISAVWKMSLSVFKVGGSIFQSNCSRGWCGWVHF